MPQSTLSTISRRHFLQAAGGSAILLLFGCRPRQTTVQPERVTATPTLVGAPAATRQSRELMITSVEEFYVQQFDNKPAVATEEWSLTVDGLVERPLTLSYGDVQARPRAELMRTLECIGNPVGGNQIGNANWAGFWLADLLAEAEVKSEAKRARFEAADGYETSVLLEWITQPGVLMAYEMNGAPLTTEHGFPLRIFMPGLYGQKMPKWITRIEFIDDEDHQGYWEGQGWSDVAAVKTNSQIMTPAHIGRVPLAEVEIYGVAYAGSRTITKVEVGVEADDTLTWREAELLPGPSHEVWTQFYAYWTPPADTSYTLLVRATDDTGFVQTERGRGLLEGSFPDGTDKIHSIVVKAG
jgi:DMSO/TMAO reductase YedYZ molybdopterin-dependent catalytic subunit